MHFERRAASVRIFLQPNFRVVRGIATEATDRRSVAAWRRDEEQMFAARFATNKELTFLYTPLKRRTPMCTLVGTVPGAMPVLIGYAAVAGKLDARAWLLYTILFLWQFPHFMAIA
jgi:UbiA prenyltransferase family